MASFTPVSRTYSRRPKRQRIACESLESRSYLSTVTFAAPTSVFNPAGGITPIAQVAANFGNGQQDIAALYTAGSDTHQSIAVELNFGNGTFTTAQTLAVGNQATEVRLADIFGNGRPDLLVNSVLDGKLSIVDANGDGTFHDTSQVLAYGTTHGTTPLNATNDFHVAALTGTNGLPDIVIADDVAHDTVVLMNQGGGFTEHILPISLTTFVLGDFTGDGKPDIAYIDGSNLSVLAGNGDGTFATTPVKYSLNIPAPLKTSGNIITGDFTGSGRADVAVELQNPSAQPTVNGAVSVLVNQSAGGFSAAQISATPPNPVGITAGDFSDDGKQDILVTGKTASDVLLSNGNGTFTDQNLSLAMASGANQPAVADFTRDAKLDFIAGDGSSGLFLYPNGARPASVLVPTVTGTVPATPFVAGQKITPFQQVVKLTNTSGVIQTKSFTLSMVVSASPDGTGGTAVATFKTRAILKPHKVLTKPFTIKSLPAGLTGTFYLVAQLSDVSGVLATADAIRPLTIAAATTDLSAAFLKVPASVKAGAKAAVTLNISQLGNIPITGGLAVQFFLSTDSTVDSADINLGTLVARVALKPGKPAKVILSPKIPAGTTGSYHIIAVVDPQNTKSDTSLPNNTAVSAGTLQIS